MPTAQQTQQDGLREYIAEQIGKTREYIDQMDGKVEEALHALRTAGETPQEVIDQLARLDARLTAQEDAHDAAEAGGAPRIGAGTGGDMARILESSEYLRRVRDNHGALGALPPSGARGIQIPTELMRSRRVERVTVDTSELAAAPTYRPGIVDWRLEATRMVDLVPAVPVTSETYHWFTEDRISGEGGIATTVDGAIVGGAGATITLDSVDNMIAGALMYIRRTDGAGTLLGYEECTIQSINTSTKVVTMTADIAGNVADGDTVITSSYAGTAESAAKPYTLLKTGDNSASMVMVAVLALITRQALLFMPQLQSWAEGKLRKTNRRNLSRQIIYGTGTGQQLQGLLAHSSRQTFTWSAGGGGVTTSVGDTMADAVLKSALLIPDEEGGIDVVMRRANWLELVAEKNADGGYLHTAQGPVALINRPGLRSIGEYVVHTESQLKPNGDYIIGRFSEASELATALSGELLWGWINDSFATNEQVARYEQAVLHAIKSTQDYVHGQFDSRPS